jgi:metal-responsive CopG/Arc/MetJ family transcriptional regulator
MGRPRLWHDTILIKFPAGTQDKVDSVHREGEDRSSFIRWAVEREIERRGAARNRSGAVEVFLRDHVAHVPRRPRAGQDAVHGRRRRCDRTR